VRRRIRRLGAGALVALLAACAQTPPQAPPAAEPEPIPEPVVEEAAPPVAARPENAPLKYLLGRKISPQPTRPLNVKSRCEHRDDRGTRTSLKLWVKEAEVKQFSARVSIPKRGTCQFELKDYAQQEKLPNVLLASRKEGDCQVRMWEQENRVTLAFTRCPAACEGDAFSYLWPIMVEAKSGRCF
jgi:hypothetical protein